MSVLYEHVDTSIEERFEFVSFMELRLDAIAAGDPPINDDDDGPDTFPPGPYSSGVVRDSEMLRLLAAA